MPGKLVVNVVPARALNKGDALIGLRTNERADTALYVGDDITDEDVFELDQPEKAADRAHRRFALVRLRPMRCAIRKTSTAYSRGSWA